MTNWWDSLGTMLGNGLINSQMPFGMSPPTDPQQRQQYIGRALADFGSEIGNQLGGGRRNAYREMQQTANENAGRAAYWQQLQDTATERKAQKEAQNRTREWAMKQPWAKDYPIDSMSGDDLFRVAVGANKPPNPPNWTTYSTGEGVFAMNPENPSQSIKLGPAPSRQSDAPTGYRFGTDGRTLEAIPGGPATKMPAEVAGRVAMLDTAEKEMPTAVKYFLEGGNSFGNEALGYTFNAGDYGRAARTVRMAIESGLRAMTGAAAPDSEVRNYENMFLPMPTDTLETRKQKLAALQNFMSQAKTIMEQGRGQTAPLGGPTEDPLGIR